jgi:zinc protease
VAGLSLAGCADVWRRTPPDTTERPEAAPPAWMRQELPSGAVLLQSGAAEGSTVHLGVSWLAVGEDPPEAPGLTALGMAALVDRVLRDELVRVGAVPRVAWTGDGGALQVTVPRESAEEVADLLARRIRVPAVDELGFTAAHGRAQAEAAIARADPQRVAVRTLDAAIFPAGHPYVHRGAATRASLQAMTRAEVTAQMLRTLVPARTMWLAIGDASVGGAIARVWSGWSPETGAVPSDALPAAHRRGPIALVDRPGLDQAVIAIGRVGLAADDADAVYAGRVMRIVRSAVHERLRGDRGLAYYTDGGHDEGRLGGRLRLLTQVDAGAAGEALKVMLWALGHVQELAVAQRWVDEQDTYDALEEVFRQASPGGRISAMARRHQLGRPPIDRPPARRPVTKLAAVSDALLLPKYWQIVCVGDRRRLQAQLEKFGEVRASG